MKELGQRGQQSTVPENQGQTRKPAQELAPLSNMRQPEHSSPFTSRTHAGEDLQRQGKSHEELVSEFRRFIQERQRLYQGNDSS